MTGPEIFEKAGGAVFKLVTRLIGSQSGRSHGTTFAIRQDGFLITNFHVVADAVEEPGKYELVLQTPQGEAKAVVAHFDAINDIALVKVERKFEKVLAIAPADDLRLGESLFSLGFPKSEELSMIQGTFNGNRLMGFAMVTAASMPLNPGMSGGPCLNARGEVVAVNRAMMLQAQNISYFSPAAALRRVAAETNSPKRNVASLSWTPRVQSDILRQERWALNLPANKAPSRQKIGSVSFNLPIGSMQCGQDADTTSRIAKVEHIFCQNVSLALAGAEINALQIRTVAAQSKSAFNPTQAFDAVSRAYENMKKEHTARRLRLRGLASGGDGDERCGARNVRNKNGLNLKVRYCSQALPEFKGLYTTFLKIEVRDRKNRATTIAQSYDGMTMETTGKMIESFLDGIAVEGDAREL
jgi:hypothetical protein